MSYVVCMISCFKHLQTSFGAFALDDLAEKPGRLLSAASVDGQSEASVPVVVYHLNESCKGIISHAIFLVKNIYKHTSTEVGPHLTVSLSSLTLQR